jgi:chitinase
VPESNEALSLVLTSPVGATLARTKATGTITNDDVATSPQTLGIADVSVIEGDPGAGGLGSGWLSTSGNQIVDGSGQRVQIAGVNWFGFESSTFAPHGLWARGYKDMMQQMVDSGFNTIRLPFSSEMLHTTRGAQRHRLLQESRPAGPVGAADHGQDRRLCRQLGLKIILDHHRSDAGAGTSGNGLWYDASHSEAQWIADWKMLATRYAAKPTVIGADLHNEPYNGTWGGGGANDWAAAAERPATRSARPIPTGWCSSRVSAPIRVRATGGAAT